MDSLTQIVLGAAVGEAVAGKKLGNKALLFGAIAGTLPDLDVLANPLLDVVGQLSFHRSVTHSLTFAIIMSPLLGWLMAKIFKKNQATYIDWGLLFFFGFVTHFLLDTCTTWGTQIFWPFSNYGYAWYNIFVVDPLYTIPFLAFTVAAAFYPRKRAKRRWLNYLGLGISSAYLLFSVYAQQKSERIFEANLKAQNIEYHGSITKATPLNTIFWTITAKADSGYYSGFYSLLDDNKEVKFDYVKQNKQLLAPFRGSEKLERLLEITKGYYTVEPAENGIYINDLRFGEFDGWRKGGGHFVFVYHVWKDEMGKLRFEEKNVRPEINRAYFVEYWNRIIGEK